MKFLRYLLLLLLALSLAARAAVTDPVGALRLKLRGASDTIVSLPLHRPALLDASLVSRSGQQLTLNASIPALPAGGAYALVMSGTLEGAVLPVTSSSGSTVTVDADSHDLSSLAASDLVAVIPYWTLDTVFPGGAGVHVSTSPIVPKTSILCYDETQVGTNIPPANSYFYFTGNTSKAAGWYRVGDMSALRGSTRLLPNRYFVARHATSSDTELLVTGCVQMAGFRTKFSTYQASRAQDNFTVLPLPVPATLDSSRLQQSGAFVESTSPISPKDQLLVFDNSVVAQNKPPVASYFYFTGNGSHPAGWYRVGDMTQNANSVALKPGEGYIVRKAATAAPETRFWTSIPSYLQ